MRTRPAHHRVHASAARMFVLIFGGLILAGLLLLAMVSVVKQKAPPSNKPVPAAVPKTNAPSPDKTTNR